MDLIIGSINTRGLGDRFERREIFNWLKYKKMSVYFIQEAHCMQNKNRGVVVNRAIKKRGYIHCLQNVTLLPFSKYTEKGVSDYILCIARV